MSVLPKNKGIYTHLQQRELSKVDSLLNRIKSVNYCSIELANKVLPKGGYKVLKLDPYFQQYLLSGDGGLYITDIEENTTIAQIPMLSDVTDVAWYPLDSGCFSSSSVDGKLKLWDANTLKCAMQFSLESTIACHSMRNDLLLAAGLTNSIRLCDVKSGASTHTLFGHTGKVNSLIWSHNQYTLLSGGQDGSIKVWDIRKAQNCIATYLNQASILGMQWTSDESFLLFAGSNSLLRLIDLVTLELKKEIRWTKGLTSRVAIQITPLECETPLAFVAQNKSISVLNLWTLASVKELKGHFGQVTSLDLSSDRFELYSSGTDREHLCWESKSPLT